MKTECASINSSILKSPVYRLHHVSYMLQLVTGGCQSIVTIPPTNSRSGLSAETVEHCYT